MTRLIQSKIEQLATDPFAQTITSRGWGAAPAIVCVSVFGESFKIQEPLAKMVFSPKLCVMLKILSSEYQLYACGKIFRMP